MREQPEPTHAPTPPLPWWLATIVILGALLTAGGGILALVRPETLIGSGQRMNEAAYVYAGYLVSRNLALAIMLLATLALRAWRMLAGLMVLAALTQLIDAVVDATTGRSFLLPVVLIFAVAFLIGVTQLSRKAPWAAAGWRDRAAPR